MDTAASDAEEREYLLGIAPDFFIVRRAEGAELARGDLKVGFDDVVASVYAPKVAASVQRLLEPDEVDAAVHEDRERILIRTSLDLDAISAVLREFWQDVVDDLARPGSE